MKSKIFFFVILNTLCDIWSYVPKSIEGKYKFDRIDYFYCYPYWLNTTMRSNYGSEQNVLEAFAPSAMVDTNGVLFAVTLYSVNSSGAVFRIGKYEPSDASINTSSMDLYPWERAGVTLGMKATPNLNSYDTDARIFKNQIYNAFCPCLAQEVSSSNYLCLFAYCPPTRFMDASSDVEGFMYFDLEKASLKVVDSGFYKGSENAICWLNRLRWCRDSDAYKFYPQVGSYQAWHANEVVNMSFIVLEDYESYEKASFYKQFNRWQNKLSIKCCEGNVTWYGGGLSIGNRYIKKGDNVYGMFVIDGYTPLLTMEDTKGSWIKKSMSWNFLYVEKYEKGDSHSTTYNYDFCILEAKDRTKIWCILGFCATGRYSSLNKEENSKYNWSATYCNWPTDKLSLTLRSCKLNDGNTFTDSPSSDADYIQNVIYTTDIQGASETAVSSTNTTKEDKYRFYLNTHKICIYESPITKHSYIIYAYCYPGKTKQLFLGYASFVIDSDYKVRLLTKTEFKDVTGNSFGNFTSCSRIISMDCKNGHLWITFMNADSKSYYYFHIKASDLVGE